MFGVEGRMRSEPVQELPQISASQLFHIMAQSLLKRHTEGKGHGCFRLEAVGSGILAAPGSAEKPKVLRE